MPSNFILAKILPPEAPRPAAEASGGSILTNVKATSAALCRPAGWIAQWRTIGNLSVLNCQTHSFA
jgi:hypothetical protein